MLCYFLMYVVVLVCCVEVVDVNVFVCFMKVVMW